MQGWCGARYFLRNFSERFSRSFAPIGWYWRLPVDRLARQWEKDEHDATTNAAEWRGGVRPAARLGRRTRDGCPDAHPLLRRLGRPPALGAHDGDPAAAGAHPGAPHRDRE